MMAKISVAMTTYNGEKYVEKQLLSLLNQTRKADEVIIKDDCSTDHTAEIVTEFIKKNSLGNWDFSVNKSNLGYKRNFYEAIKQTTGDIIFLCDQDDIWYSNKLKTIEAIFNNNTEVKALSSSFKFIDGQDNNIKFYDRNGFSNNNLINAKIPVDSLYKIDTDIVLQGNISPGCVCAFSKEVCLKFINNSAHRIPHDWELNIYAAIMNGLYFYNKPLIGYRIHGKNTIGMKTDNRLELKIKGNRSIRLQVLSEQQALINIFTSDWIFKTLSKQQIRKILKFQKYVNNREICINKFNLSAYLKLCFAYPFLCHLSTVSFRSLLGDFIYMIKD